MTSEIQRAIDGFLVAVPGVAGRPDDDDDGLAEAAARSGGPGLAAAAADSVAQSSAAAAPSGAPTPYTGQSPPPLPMPTPGTRRRGPAQPQVFAMDADDEVSGSGGARRASAKKALAQLLLHRSRK